MKRMKAGKFKAASLNFPNDLSKGDNRNGQ
jgi:hypothetical protein